MIRDYMRLFSGWLSDDGGAASKCDLPDPPLPWPDLPDSAGALLSPPAAGDQEQWRVHQEVQETAGWSDGGAGVEQFVL